MIKASVIGSTGYAGIELIRLLYNHPQVELIHLISNSCAGKSISDIYPSFKGLTEKLCIKMDIDKITRESDVVFTALPHKISQQVVPMLHEKGVKIIDLSGDFRYKSAKTYEKWYEAEHSCPQLLKESVYGLPELYREEIKNAHLVGNPGCYPTCAILGMAPLVAEKIIDTDSIIIDAKSGATGAGRGLSLNTHFCELDENTKAYKVAKHRHTSEIEQELGNLAGKEVAVSFTPHLLPIKRGILSTMYANIAKPCSHEEICRLYREFYKDSRFVTIYKEGMLPEVKYVNGSNMCHIGFVIDERLNRIIVVSTIDNLIKGAAGQAIQNMNIMFGLDETAGLLNPAWYL